MQVFYHLYGDNRPRLFIYWTVGIVGEKSVTSIIYVYLKCNIHIKIAGW